MTNKRIVAWVGVAGMAVALGSAGTTLAQQAGARRPGQRPLVAARALAARLGPLAGIRLQLRELRLSPEQRQQVQAIFQKHQADIQQLRDARQAGREAGTAEARQKVRTDMQTFRATLMKEVMGVLTPEQRAVVEAQRQLAAARQALRQKK
jgi:Spy/CpxP family protein refolding chaperone